MRCTNIRHHQTTARKIAQEQALLGVSIFINDGGRQGYSIGSRLQRWKLAFSRLGCEQIEYIPVELPCVVLPRYYLAWSLVMPVIVMRFALVLRAGLLALHLLLVICIAAGLTFPSGRIVLSMVGAVAVACWTYHRTLAVMSAIGLMQHGPLF